jgi:hypothetical protein
MPRGSAFDPKQLRRQETYGNKRYWRISAVVDFVTVKAQAINKDRSKIAKYLNQNDLLSTDFNKLQ